MPKTNEFKIKSTADVLPIKKQVKTFTPAAIKQVTLRLSSQDLNCESFEHETTL